jgi:hypothetical protein
LRRAVDSSSYTARMDLLYGEGDLFQREIRQESDARMCRAIVNLNAMDLFGRDRVRRASPAPACRRARLAERGISRLVTELHRVVRTGDRTQKGRRLGRRPFVLPDGRPVSLPSKQVAGTGFERPAKNTGNTAGGLQGGAESGALGVRVATSDPLLEELLAAWPALSAEARTRIVAFLKTQLSIPASAQ